jgi:dihydrofolate synthase/folylpolyglutamate synthase
MIDRNQETTVCFVVGSFYLAGMAKEFINQEEENVRL